MFAVEFGFGQLRHEDERERDVGRCNRVCVEIGWAFRSKIPRLNLVMGATQWIRVRAPGRAEVLGNHTDYNAGLVLAVAVEMGLEICGTARADGVLKFESLDLGRQFEGCINALEPSKEEPWANYLLGVLAGLRARGVRLGGAELQIQADLPAGAGLSSSAALEIAAALFFQKLYPFEMEPLELARVAQEAEHRFAGVQCGLLDQLSILLSRRGRVTRLDFESLQVETLPLPSEVCFVLVSSGVKHALVSGEYNERRASCEAAAKRLGVRFLRNASMQDLDAAAPHLPEGVVRRARHVIGENERVMQASEALGRGDVSALGQAMLASHISSRVNFENSCPELDDLVELARQAPGCLGARLSGGGFGGVTINLVQRRHLDAFTAYLLDRYRNPGGHAPAIWTTEAASGALEALRQVRL